MNDFTLAKDGDIWEQNYSNLVTVNFPNYEHFWREFIVPLTNRRFRQSDLYICRGLNPLQEQLAMAHYSVFRHLAIVHRMVDASNFSDEVDNIISTDTILFHLSAVTEMVDRFLMIVSQIKARVQNPELPVITEKTVDEITESVCKQYRESYKKHLERFLQTGQTVSYSVHDIRDFPEIWLADDGKLGEEWSKHYQDFTSLSNQIRSYRNVLTHNPILGYLVLGDGRLGIPKAQGRLNKYKLQWSKVFYESSRDDFEPIDTFLKDKIAELEKVLNEMWKLLLELMNNLMQAPTYQEWLANIKEPPAEERDYPGVDSLPPGVNHFSSGSPAARINKCQAREL